MRVHKLFYPSQTDNNLTGGDAAPRRSGRELVVPERPGDELGGGELEVEIVLDAEELPDLGAAGGNREDSELEDEAAAGQSAFGHLADHRHALLITFQEV